MGKPSKDYAVPLWEKANLTVYEAAAYSGIGADTDSEHDVQVLRERFLEWKNRSACELNRKY